MSKKKEAGAGEFEVPMDAIVTSEAPIKVVAQTDGNAKRIQAKQPKRKITIDEVEGGLNYETVSCNGVDYQIMRGEEVSVPQCVVDILKDSVAYRLVKTKRPDGTEDFVKKKYCPIPWRLVG